jgi:hypothetical protein
MTKGNIKRQFEQVGYPPIRISILNHSQLVKFEQDNNIIYVRFPYMDEFVFEIYEIKQWTKPKKDEVELEKW